MQRKVFAVLVCWRLGLCAGKLSHIHSWLNRLLQLGPAYGYFAEPTKSFLVVAEQYEEEAKELFKDHGVIVVYQAIASSVG